MDASRYFALAILCMLAATFATRAVPFLLAGRLGRLQWFQVIVRDLPVICMPVLVVYCLKGVEFTKGPHGIPEIVAVAAVATLQWRVRRSLLSIFGGTAIYLALKLALSAIP